MSECGCIYMGVDNDAQEVVTTRTARKEHRCGECRQLITKGERYELRTQFDEGTASSYKTCLCCAEIRNAFFCEGWFYGSVWEDINDSMFDRGPLNSACLDKLSTVAAKQFLQRRWMEWVDRRLAREAAQAVDAVDPVGHSTQNFPRA